MENDVSGDQAERLGLGFWTTLIRAVFVIMLGLAMILTPDKSHVTLYNFMGMFWLMSGVVLLRREAHQTGSRLLQVAGFAGVLAGIMVITRSLTRNYLSEFLVTDLLGVVVLMTGILHIMSGIRVRKGTMSGRMELNIMMGIFEILLGGILLFTQKGNNTLMYLVATIWALLGGAFLFLDAWRQYRKNKAEG